MAKLHISVIYGEDHPLYKITLTGLLDELSMYERMKGLNPSNIKSNRPTKKYHEQELTYDTDRFEDVTNLELDNSDNQSKLISGWISCYSTYIYVLIFRLTHVKI